MPAVKTAKSKRLFKTRLHKKWENPKVTVIVPVYKVDKYLTQCLSSIVNQTMEELEIIIVDEGEQDRCREIIDYFETHDPRIVAPHRKNGGYGASCNLGIDMARGEYMAIVESDDYIEPEMYEEMYAYAKALDADVVKTPYTNIFKDGRRQDCYYRAYMAQRAPKNNCFSVKQFGELLEVHASLWSAIYRTEYMREHAIRFIETKGAYVDVGFRIDTLIHTDKIAWLDQPYYNYRIDSEGSTTNNFKIDQMIQRWKEQHVRFAPIQEIYDSYYGKHLLMDEYLNTVLHFGRFWVSRRDCLAIGENLQYVSDETIRSATALRKRHRKELIDCKKNPVKVRNKMYFRMLCKKWADILERFCQKLTNPIFVSWLFSISLASSAILNYMANFLSPSHMAVFCTECLILLSSLGLAACLGAKCLKRILNTLRRHYETQE